MVLPNHAPWLVVPRETRVISKDMNELARTEVRNHSSVVGAEVITIQKPDYADLEAQSTTVSAVDL